MNLENFSNYLPIKPYCADDISNGLKIYSKKFAIKKKYLQLNHPNSIKFLIFDCDHEAGYIAEQGSLPRPTWKCGNLDNGKAHLVYALKTPIHKNAFSNYKPLKFLSAIQDEMTSILSADQQYVGLITKNPLNLNWRVEFSGIEYELIELAEFLPGLLKHKKKAKKKISEQSGLGRNCSLFDELRLWSYTAVEKNRGKIWYEAVLYQARSINSFFLDPLSESEIRGIAKSVANWTARYFGQNDGGKTQWHRSQQRKSVKLRISKSSDLRLKAKELWEQGRKKWEISCLLDIPQSTIHDWLK
ncbi:MAG: replication initiation protein [Acidocella sp.]|nr:replication initiation protein [Acidocella sp.]